MSKEEINAGILYEVQDQKGDQERQTGRPEKRSHRHPGCLPSLRNQDVPYGPRQEVTQSVIITLMRSGNIEALERIKAKI